MDKIPVQAMAGPGKNGVALVLACCVFGQSRTAYLVVHVANGLELSMQNIKAAAITASKSQMVRSWR